MIRHYKKALQTKQAWRAFSLSGSRVALRVECDLLKVTEVSIYHWFQSTHSVWSATPLWLLAPR